MASSVQAPPPPPPPVMPPRQPRSFAGPVVLIVLGVFFLLRSLGLIPWYNWGRMFAHYWPLLLILWGVVKLIEYQQANRAGIRPRGLGAVRRPDASRARCQCTGPPPRPLPPTT